MKRNSMLLMTGVLLVLAVVANGQPVLDGYLDPEYFSHGSTLDYQAFIPQGTAKLYLIDDAAVDSNYVWTAWSVGKTYNDLSYGAGKHPTWPGGHSFGDLLESDNQRIWIFNKCGKAIDEANRMRGIAQEFSDTGGFNVDPESWYRMQTAKINLLKQVEDRLSQDLLTKSEERAAVASARLRMVLSLILITLGTTAFLVVYFMRAILVQVGDDPARIQAIAEQIAKGNMDVEVDGGTGIRASIGAMLSALRENRDEAQRQDRLKTGIARLNDTMRGDPNVATLASKVIAEMASYLNAQVGAFYLAVNGDGTELSLQGSYAYRGGKNAPSEFKLGEGLIGQAAQEKKCILVTDVPEDCITVTSALGETLPRNIVCFPLLYEGEVKGVVELGSLEEFTDRQLDFLDQVGESVAIAVHSAQSREQMKILQESEGKLKVQSEELQVTNEELAEKTVSLERQKREVEQTNAELEETRQEIEKRAEDLALASKYKSEFLANMSHELRTPLNSLLILATSLAENGDGNLTDDQVESARVIHDSGNDLLSLINEILDLSKIEAGQMDILFDKVAINDLADGVRNRFKHVFDDKGLELKILIDKSSPAEITSDRKRIEQIIRNLISNAVKFTSEGSVTVAFSHLSFVNDHWEDSKGRFVDLRVANESSPMANDAPQASMTNDEFLVISVTDTGVGVPAEKQEAIFEAFQQADGGTSRKYGGTGLGLSICRELVRLLGGEIRLASEEGKGSTFTVYLPTEAKTPADVAPQRSERKPYVRKKPLPLMAPASVPDDRDGIVKGDKAILVVEDDPVFAKLLLRQCREKGFKCLIAATGEEGLRLACEQAPSAVILDIRLPGIDGWSVLDQLKEKVETRHVPVHIISVEEPSQEALTRGAIGFLRKPVSPDDLQAAFVRIEDVLRRTVKGLLVVEDDEKLRKAIVKLVGNGDVNTDDAPTGKAAIEKPASKRYDCMILDLNLPDMSGFELLEKAEKMETVVLPPVVVYTGRELTRDEEKALRRYSESIIVKGVRSQERLFDEVSLFLHRVVEHMPKERRQLISDLHNADSILRDKKVLIVDDDMRTLFALSNALSTKGTKTIKAEDGKKALEILKTEPDIDLVLMDIMMPVMDGYETMKRIRAQERFDQVPIIALTAKAMKLDRKKCVDAGASDYLPKPVEANWLFSMMRAWMYR
ncbi:MAG: response regulator [Kiritimatiellia bacterium]|nr:response regulator [Kiritimatiellia bacterium]